MLMCSRAQASQGPLAPTAEATALTFRSTGCARSVSTRQKVHAASFCEAEQTPSSLSNPRSLAALLSRAALKDAMGTGHVQSLLFLLLLLGAPSLACKDAGLGDEGKEMVHRGCTPGEEGLGAGGGSPRGGQVPTLVSFPPQPNLISTVTRAYR